MDPQFAVPIPFIIEFAHLSVEDVAIFCVAILITVTVNAEAQAFAATILGDARTENHDRLHFNAFLHLDVWGTICFFIAGFGWPKQFDINRERFAHPRMYMAMVRVAGPLANFIMANIAGSLIWIIGNFGFEDRVFSIVMAVNAMAVVYSLLIIPPCAGASIIFAFIPEGRFTGKFIGYLQKNGPFIILGMFLVFKITHYNGLSDFLDPAVRYICLFITGQ